MNIRPGLFVLSALVTALSGQASAVEVEQRPLSESAPRPVAAPPTPPQAQPQPIVQPQPPRPVAATAPVAPTATAVAPARPATTGGNPAWDVFQQLDSLQSTVARLQGQLEEQQQLVDRLKQDLKVRYTDLDQRLEQLSQKPGGADSSSTPTTAPAAAVAPAETATPAAPAVSTPAPVTPAPVAVAPAIAPAASPAPTPAPAAPVVTEPKPVVVPVAAPVRQDVGADEIEKQKQAYLAAYQRLRSDGPAAAITAMTGFTQKYPDSVFSPNAHYWLGEFQLATDPANYDAAETSFRRVIKDYDGSPKVPAAYYKLGTVADLRGKRDDARRWMSEVITRFASSPEARLAQSYLDQNPAGAARPK